ncbi:MAG: hypothetical protein ACJA19_001342 [Bacteroidia bacterium]|mgnify:FL=1|jgi:hypothetical protein|tara:strand:+ start:546 stop:1007 length:462 start_codon:yes stop_codon:yes gene_type:complete
MKKLIILTLAAGLFASCGTNEANTVAGNYGNTAWDTTEAITGEQLMEQLSGQDSVYTTVSGNIAAACQAKGCWMNMNIAGNEMFVKFKDYGFLVPKNSAEHNAIIKGWAYQDTISVKDRIEYARDAEATEEEIAAITEPEVKLTFMAEGVVMK